MNSVFFWCIWAVFGCIFLGEATEKAVAPHSSTLAWKIPWMEEPGREGQGSLTVQESSAEKEPTPHFFPAAHSDWKNIKLCNHFP